MTYSASRNPERLNKAIDECVKEATLLEACGKEPFDITQDGHFYSTRSYPKITLELDSMYLPRIGNCLLDTYSDHGDFALGYGRGIHQTSHSHDVGEEPVFQSGLPLVNDKTNPYVFGKEPNTTVYVVLEFYGPNAIQRLREQLASPVGLKVINPKDNAVYTVCNDDPDNMIKPL